MRERDYLRLKRQIEAEYRRKLDALEMVWSLAGGSHGRVATPQRAAVQSLVRRFLDEWRGGEFSLENVVQHIHQNAPNLAINRASLSGALRRLALSGDIEIVSMGKGARASRYRPIGGRQAA
jgi:hypothetical protein